MPSHAELEPDSSRRDAEVPARSFARVHECPRHAGRAAGRGGSQLCDHDGQQRAGGPLHSDCACGQGASSAAALRGSLGAAARICGDRPCTIASHTPPPLAPGCAGREALQQDPRQGYRHPLAGTHLLHPALTPTLTTEPQPQRCFQPQTSPQSIPGLDATHPQVITDFCEDFGVPRAMRGALIKKAKTTGGLLGFLN